MAKAAKKSHGAGTSDGPSTSCTKPKKGDETSRQVRNKITGKTGSRAGGKVTGHKLKVRKPIKKGKRPLPRIPKRKSSEKTNTSARKPKKARGKAAFGHYHRLMEELNSEPEQEARSLDNTSEPGREPRNLENTSDPAQEPRSLESSTISTCDLESQ